MLEEIVNGGALGAGVYFIIHSNDERYSLIFHTL